MLLDNPKVNTTSGIFMRSRAVREIHSFLALSSGITFGTFLNSVDCFKTSLCETMTLMI